MKPPLRKRRTREHVIADLSVNHVERHILKCGCVVKRPTPDYGIDLELITFNKRGEIELLREDIGRHNAVDKVVGRALLDGRLPLARSVLAVSGRAGYEVVQKAVAAGIPILAAVGAPSSLAVATAERFGMTLVGFLRDDRFNVYTSPERVGR